MKMGEISVAPVSHVAVLANDQQDREGEGSFSTTVAGERTCAEIALRPCLIGSKPAVS